MNDINIDENRFGNDIRAAFDPTVTALQGGGFVVASTADDDVSLGVLFQMFDAQGNPVGRQKEVGAFRVDEADAAIAPLEDGGFIVFFETGAGGRQIRGQRSDAEGELAGAEFLVTDKAGADLDATRLPDNRVAVSYALVEDGTTEAVILDGRPEIIRGTDGDDNLTGRAGDDTLEGGAGADTLNGFGGDDSMLGGDGNDRMNGNAGDDVVLGGDGDDQLFGSTGDDTLGGGDGDDQLFGGDSNDDPDGGQGGNDMLSGGDGDDVLSLENSGDSTLDGGNGNDRLFSDSGDDLLLGGAGNDTTNRGGGDDQFEGGDGADTFRFSIAAQNSEIRDFDALDDDEVIDLSGIFAITDFADLAANHLSQVGQDAVITEADGIILVARPTNITLTGVDLADLDANDFLF